MRLTSFDLKVFDAGSGAEIPLTPQGIKESDLTSGYLSYGAFEIAPGKEQSFRLPLPDLFALDERPSLRIKGVFKYSFSDNNIRTIIKVPYELIMNKEPFQTIRSEGG